MLKKLLAIVSIAMIAMLVFVACGDDDDSDDTDTGDTSSTTTTGTTASGDDVEVTVVKMSEMKFDPDAITVGAGEEVTIDLQNDGSVEHNFSINDADVDHSLGAGESDEFTFTAPTEPGEYNIHCNVPGHEQAGMVATLIVE